MMLVMPNSIHHGDCLEIMRYIQDKSIDMICADLPYGKTRNGWDSIIDLNLLWTHYNRIIKDNGAIILFGQDKFTALLINSNIRMHRYNLIWEKTTPTGFLNARKMPLRIHEDICVFYKKIPVYNPIKTLGHKPVNSYTKHTSDGSNYGRTKLGISGGGSTERLPTSIWKYPTDKQKISLHPTQKPVRLIEDLIKTYSNPGDLVLDNVAGSGTTGVEQRGWLQFNFGRQWRKVQLLIQEKRWIWRKWKWWRVKGCYLFKTCPRCLLPKSDHTLCKYCKEETRSQQTA